MGESNYDHLFKILIIGDSGVGKSSLMVRFCDDAFNEQQLSTIGVDFKVKYMVENGKRLKMAIWDTAGQERFRTLTSSYYRGAQGIILVYDCTKRDSFDSLSHWLEEIKTHCTHDDAIKMLVANKVDLPNQQVPRSEGEEFAFSHNMLFIETSAKTRVGITQAFEELVLKILDTPPLLVNTRPLGQRIDGQNQQSADGCGC